MYSILIHVSPLVGICITSRVYHLLIHVSVCITSCIILFLCIIDVSSICGLDTCITVCITVPRVDTCVSRTTHVRSDLCDLRAGALVIMYHWCLKRVWECDVLTCICEVMCFVSAAPVFGGDTLMIHVSHMYHHRIPSNNPPCAGWWLRGECFKRWYIYDTCITSARGGQQR